jgi:hypothetical protein
VAANLKQSTSTRTQHWKIVTLAAEESHAASTKLVPAGPFDVGKSRLRRLVAYGRDVYDLREGLAKVTDARKEPITEAPLIAAAIFFCGLLRIRSFNALEPKLHERPFVRLAGAEPDVEELCSADTISRALRAMDLETVRALSVRIIEKAERNKVVREGWHSTLRYVALDGWEPISSRRRHCDACLVRKVPVKQRDGSIVLVEEHYHRFVVAMLIDERLDLVLDIEPLLPADLRPGEAGQSGQDEGELTAARRLLRRVKQTFGWLDVVVCDGLYPNGSFLTDVKQLGMGAVIIARKEGDEPLKEALAIWGNEPPTKVVVDDERAERIELWDCPEIQTLSSYDGPIRVVRGCVQRTRDETAPTHTWCMVVTGKATRLSAEKALAVARGRWHIENTGFHQWVTRWKFAHVFVHDDNGLRALYWLFFAAFNLLTLFLYRQLRSYGRDRGNNVTRTISRLIDEMLDDLARLDASPWDTS